MNSAGGLRYANPPYGHVLLLTSPRKRGEGN